MQTAAQKSEKLGENKRAERSGGIQSLERAAAILDVVAGSPEGVTLAVVSERVGLHTSTTFHLIKTLTSLGFVIQDAEGKKYRIGSRVFTLAAAAKNENTLTVLGIPVLERLSAITGEAAHLAVRSQTDIVLVARTAAAGMLQMSERTGVSRPAHATAIGKVLLAHMKSADLDTLVASLALPKLTEHTITDRNKFREELTLVKADGIAHDRCEFDPDVRCIAFPVFDFSNTCVAAIGISGPVWRMSPDILEAKTASLRNAASEMSKLIGYRGAAAE